MYSVKRALRIRLILLFFILLFSGNTCFSENILSNGAFEESDLTSAVSWKTGIWTGKAVFRTTQEGREGSRCAKITSRKDGTDAGWRAVVSVQPHTTYKLSGWIKTEDVKTGQGRGAFLNIHELEGVRTKALTETTDWTYLEVPFNTVQREEVTVNCMLGGWGKSEGTAWYDDIRLEVIRQKEEPILVPLDISKTGCPISPYVYGQLIEHVGKCVYGGMWAEMLENRKFFFPITDNFNAWIPQGQENYTADAVYTVLKGSPWRVIGPAETVTMNTESMFTGEHSPQINAQGDGKPYGIEQGRLGLVQNKQYTGRIYLAGEETAAPILISLVWGEDDNQKQTITVRTLSNDKYTEIPLNFTAGAATDEGHLEIISRGQGSYRIGCVSLMPSDNLNGWRRDVIQLLRELNSPIYKWPGGNFVSGYDWMEGIGNRDRRRPQKNPHWYGLEDNDVGIHEFMDLCELLDTEPALAVSSGFGDAEHAAKLVEYVNGSQTTIMGGKRAQNGHPEPYGIKLFYVGNEMWGNHQVGYVPLNLYTKKHNRIVQSMKAIDPTIQVVAVGRVGSWGEVMLTECAEQMDFISDNFYRTGAKDLLNHANSMVAAVRYIVNAHRQYRVQLPSLRNKNIPLVLDEWGYWYSQKKYGDLGYQYFLEDAPGIAMTLHEMFRNSDIVQVVHYAQAVNVLGAIKTSKTAATFDTPGLVLKLYRNHLGTLPVNIEGTTVPLDVFASLTEDKKYLTISIVNPTEFQQKIKIDIGNAHIDGEIESFVITGKNRKDFNEPGRNPTIQTQKQSMTLFPDILEICPISVTLLKCPLD